jgi:hypothetical protein
VLLLSLQFKRGLAFLLKSDMAKAYRLDGIHLAIALHFTGVSGVHGSQSCKNRHSFGTRR